MSSIGTGFDLSITSFSPDGRVFQIEYAAKAVDDRLCSTVVGIKCKDGIIIGVEKLLASKMMLPGSNWRIHSVHRHCGVVCDEAKDKAFELELNWVCDEPKHQHQKVPNELLEEAKSAAVTALEEMDAD